jgi:hypothetical protein
MVCSRAGNVEGGYGSEPETQRVMGSTIYGAAAFVSYGRPAPDMRQPIAALSAARGLALQPGAAR